MRDTNYFHNKNIRLSSSTKKILALLSFTRALKKLSIGTTMFTIKIFALFALIRKLVLTMKLDFNYIV